MTHLKHLRVRYSIMTSILLLLGAVVIIGLSVFGWLQVWIGTTIILLMALAFAVVIDSRGTSIKDYVKQLWDELTANFLIVLGTLLFLGFTIWWTHASIQNMIRVVGK